MAVVTLLAGQAYGHSFVIPMGAAADKTHYIGVVCSTDGGTETDHLYLQVQSQTSNGPLISVQAHKGVLATNTTDPVGGDAAPSPPVVVKGGNGLYQVLMNKSGFGEITYLLTVHCMDATGTIHTGTDFAVFQYE
jgi:hypothetical protein